MFKRFTSFSFSAAGVFLIRVKEHRNLAEDLVLPSPGLGPGPDPGLGPW